MISISFENESLGQVIYLTNASASKFNFSPISQDDVSNIIASLRSKS